MPLYFILSGMFFKDYGGFKNLLIKKTNKLLIPFAFFYLIGYAAFYMLKATAPGMIKTIAANGILDVFTQIQYFNGPIWFLLSLFWINLIFCGISLVVKNEVVRAGVILLIGIVGGGIGENNIFLPCALAPSMTSLPYFYIGYLMKRTPILYPNKYDKYLLISAACLYCVAVGIDNLAEHPYIGFHYNSIHGNALIFFLVSNISVLAVLFLCKKIGKLPFISYFGRYSIIPLCVHHLIYRPLLVMFNHMDFEYSRIAVAILTILICYALIPVCRRFLPYVTAQKEVITYH